MTTLHARNRDTLLQGKLSTALGGKRHYSTRASIRHFPKHLLRRPGEEPRPPRISPAAMRREAEASDVDEFDPKARFQKRTCLLVLLKRPSAKS